MGPGVGKGLGEHHGSPGPPLGPASLEKSKIRK